MWEALAAIGSILSAIVIAVTVIFAARQVRVTLDQLEQVRKATQFEAARTVLQDLADPEFVDAYLFVYHDLAKMMATPAFRRDVALIGLSDDSVHKEMRIARAFERIGTYVRYGLVEGAVVYSTYAGRILMSYELLKEVLAIHREIVQVPLYENFDFLYEDCRRWLASRGVAVDIAAVNSRIAEYQAKFPVIESAAGGR
jgi:hypothetical protein